MEIRFRGVTAAFIAGMIVGVIVGLATASIAKQPVAPGVERWSVKTGQHFDLTQKAQFLSIANLLNLPAPLGVQHNDSRYQDAVIPGGVEGQLVQTEGFLWLVAAETDGDYHVQIAPSAKSGDGCLIVEVPKPSFAASALTEPTLQARSALRAALGDVNREPASEGTVVKKPTTICVEGFLFFDDAHVGDPPRGKKKMHAATLWEIHPVIGVRRGHCS